jgi:magnesium-transporting ATPase (P-type)
MRKDIDILTGPDKEDLKKLFVYTKVTLEKSSIKKIRRKMTFYTVLFNWFTILFLCGTIFFPISRQMTFQLYFGWMMLAIVMLQFQLDLSCRLFDLIFKSEGKNDEESL